MKTGRINLAAGLLAIAGFMLYGFLLIYLRDFAPGKEEWIASYSTGKHFEARLAHVHGALFALINIVMGLVIPRIPDARARGRVAALALAGLLMPTGILAEVYLGLSPVLVILGGIAIFLSVAWAGLSMLRAPVEVSP